MAHSKLIQLAGIAAPALVLTLIAVGQLPAQDPAPNNGRVEAATAWSLDEALAQLRMYPRDPYLQYVALQLATREGRADVAVNELNRQARSGDWRRGRAGQADLFSIFTGALAVQESLQLDTMVGPDGIQVAPDTVVDPDQPAPDLPKSPVALKELQGPTVKSHPWAEMLSGRTPESSPLAVCVPEDYFYVEFHSVAKLLTLLEQGDLWGTHLFSQTANKAYRHTVRERTLKQLALEDHELLQPFYDLAVQELAVTGSDLFATEGSDVTLLFRLHQRPVFQAQMDGFLDNAHKNTPGVVREAGQYRNVPFVHLTTPDRSVHVYSAYPSEKLHVRSNSQVAFQRILDTIADRDSTSTSSLGNTDEFKYIRTLMPYGAAEEDGLIYLSDPFIRHMVGPQLKLTELRRRICLNHLRMIGHAAALHQTQYGKPPTTLAELATSGCAPGTFGQERLACPSGGEYALASGGMTGTCSHHGSATFLTPCCEIPVSEVSAEEARGYRSFVQQYSQYWRTFFDPIAVRVQVTPQRYRLETIVLPLIDNSIYTNLASALGGEPEQLDLAPITSRNIFSVSIKLDKERLLEEAGWQPPAEQPSPARQSWADVQQTGDNLRQLGLAMHNYHDVHKRLPAVASFDKAKRPLLSWRVHLLPFLEAKALYDQFHLDEPWDSPHNRALVRQMPDVYRSPGGQPAERGVTGFVLAVGADTLFTGTPQGLGFRDVRDGTSNTIMILHVGDEHRVAWTKPEDIPLDMQKVRSAMFEDTGGKAAVCFADGSVRFLPDSVGDQSLRALLTRSGGEVVEQRGEAVSGRRDRRLPFQDLLVGNVTERDLYEFVTKGLSNKLSMHVYDADQLFDFQLIGFLGQAMGNFAGRGGGRIDDGMIPFVFLGASLNSPVYISVPIEDARVVDRFLEQVDLTVAKYARTPERGGFFGIEKDFYTLSLESGLTARSAGLQFGPIKWRFFWARIGDSLYIASKPYILEDLAASLATAGDAPAGAAGVSDVKGHAMIRVRPDHWNQVLPAYRLGWAERHRQACLDNVGRLSSLARVVSAQPPQSPAAGQGLPAGLDELAGQIHGLHFFCPEGGNYLREGHGVCCSLHGTAEEPRQSAVPQSNRAIDRLLQDFSDLTVTLTFLEDGLHAVFLIERE